MAKDPRPHKLMCLTPWWLQKKLFLHALLDSESVGLTDSLAATDWNWMCFGAKVMGCRMKGASVAPHLARAVARRADHAIAEIDLQVTTMQTSLLPVGMMMDFLIANSWKVCQAASASQMLRSLSNSRQEKYVV